MSDITSAPPPSTEGEPRQGRSVFSTILNIVWYGMLFNFAIRFLSTQFSAKPRSDLITPSQEVRQTEVQNPHQYYTNVLRLDDLYDFFIFTSKDEKKSYNQCLSDCELIWHLKNEEYNTQWSKPYLDTTLEIEPSSLYLEDISTPSDLYLHAFMVPNRWKDYMVLPDPIYQISTSYNLIRWRTLTSEEKKRSNMKSLIYSSKQEEKNDVLSPSLPSEETELLPYLVTKLDIRIIADVQTFNTQLLSQPMFDKVKVFPQLNRYHPVVYVSDFWAIDKDFVPLKGKSNDSSPVSIKLSYNVHSLWTLALETQSRVFFDMQQDMGMQSAKEESMMKKMLLETSPWMLLFTAVFVLLHSLFSFLAFKNDVSYWNNTRSKDGISSKMVVFEFIAQLIICLYLLDSSETSSMLLFEIVLRLVLDGWKVTKVYRIEFSLERRSLSIHPKHVTPLQTITQKHEATAIKYTSYILIPIYLLYSIYSLFYNKYTSWYNYVISSMAGVIYIYGFIFMIPQLYINYRLKTVDHMPWRAMIYKFFNTFIDDVFSFIIPMPWYHRIACLRDDLIFIIYLYQMYIYRNKPVVEEEKQIENQETLTLENKKEQ